MHLTPLEHSAVADGTALSLSGLFWPRPYFPSRSERVALIAGLVPGWAIATANTAGWIWTGMGSPLPFALLRPSRPAISPLAREHWAAREFRAAHHGLARVGGFDLLDRTSTAQEIMSHGSDVDGSATQLLFLTHGEPPQQDWSQVRMSPARRHRATQILARWAKLAEDYPDITR